MQMSSTVPGGGMASIERVVFLIFLLTPDTNARVLDDKRPHWRERGSILRIVV